MLLKQILYVSRCAAPAHPGALRSTIAQILETSLHNNRRDHITGLFGYADGGFIQLIEGPALEIDELLDRLLMDPRHRDLTIRAEQRCPARLFGAWSMAVVPPGSPELTAADLVSADAAVLVERLQRAAARRLAARPAWPNLDGTAVKIDALRS